MELNRTTNIMTKPFSTMLRARRSAGSVASSMVGLPAIAPAMRFATPCGEKFVTVTNSYDKKIPGLLVEDSSMVTFKAFERATSLGSGARVSFIGCEEVSEFFKSRGHFELVDLDGDKPIDILFFDPDSDVSLDAVEGAFKKSVEVCVLISGGKSESAYKILDGGMEMSEHKNLTFIVPIDLAESFRTMRYTDPNEALFCRMLGHEINNPITAVKCWPELLSDKGEDGESVKELRLQACIAESVIKKYVDLKLNFFSSRHFVFHQLREMMKSILEICTRLSDHETRDEVVVSAQRVADQMDFYLQFNNEDFLILNDEVGKTLEFFRHLPQDELGSRIVEFCDRHVKRLFFEGGFRYERGFCQLLYLLRGSDFIAEDAGLLGIINSSIAQIEGKDNVVDFRGVELDSRYLKMLRELLNHEVLRNPLTYIHAVSHPSTVKRLKFGHQDTFSHIYMASKQIKSAVKNLICGREYHFASVVRGILLSAEDVIRYAGKIKTDDPVTMEVINEVNKSAQRIKILCEGYLNFDELDYMILSNRADDAVNAIISMDPDSAFKRIDDLLNVHIIRCQLDGGFLFGSLFNKFLSAARNRLSEQLMVLIEDEQEEIKDISGINSIPQVLLDKLE